MTTGLQDQCVRVVEPRPTVEHFIDGRAERCTDLDRSGGTARLHEQPVGDVAQSNVDIVHPTDRTPLARDAAPVDCNWSTIVSSCCWFRNLSAGLVD